MTRTGNQLLTQLSRYIGDLDFPEGLLTTATGSTTTVVSTQLSRFGDDYLNDWYARVTVNVAGNQYLARRISGFVSSTGTATVNAFAGTTGSGTAFELHRIAPHEKFSALDEARLTVFPALGTLVYDDTITGDGVQHTFDIPSSVRRGPIDVFIECPMATYYDWNFLGAPNGDDTSLWSASSATAATVSWDSSDAVIPKFTDSDATKITIAATTAATYTQVVANMVNGVTAALAAGRKMTYAKWYYSTVASAVRLGITDASTTVYGSYHQGRGWELLTVEATIAGNNSTTLSVVDDFASVAAAHTYFCQRGWFYYGAAEKVVESWEPISPGFVRRDNTTQQFRLSTVPPRGYQLRLVGRGLLSALGNTASTQATNTMEVDEAEAELLVAEAAKVLFRRGLLSSAVMDGLAIPMQANEQTLRDLRQTWAQHSPGPRMKSMWG